MWLSSLIHLVPISPLSQGQANLRSSGGLATNLLVPFLCLAPCLAACHVLEPAHLPDAARPSPQGRLADWQPPTESNGNRFQQAVWPCLLVVNVLPLLPASVQLSAMRGDQMTSPLHMAIQVLACDLATQSLEGLIADGRGCRIRAQRPDAKDEVVESAGIAEALRWGLSV
ncbi:uncharacterized protein CLUP02_15405 [Colletotrichum lupini]|uniref:Uncharacterized protein n=1 Tax=Colletotrichum lupini TaxID=145971 RepID=A0A9Q8WNI0_9PEZI|nr:uncharacterized protein CLUP02_15405 [Colletotrichum lupini]UQC89874.1 hypothetical protein CLUP02_15405 [Colletotrichum lupini]